VHRFIGDLWRAHQKRRSGEHGNRPALMSLADCIHVLLLAVGSLAQRCMITRTSYGGGKLPEMSITVRRSL
jgi:hypothetical protein